MIKRIKKFNIIVKKTNPPKTAKGNGSISVPFMNSYTVLYLLKKKASEIKLSISIRDALKLKFWMHLAKNWKMFNYLSILLNTSDS